MTNMGNSRILMRSMRTTKGVRKSAENFLDRLKTMLRGLDRPWNTLAFAANDFNELCHVAKSCGSPGDRQARYEVRTKALPLNRGAVPASLLSCWWKTSAGLVFECLKPQLMELVHSVWHEKVPEARQPTVLRLLSDHAAPLGGWLQDPRMINIDAEAATFPCDTLIRHALKYRRLDRNTKCLPAKPGAFSKIWAWSLKDFNIR